MTDRAELKSGQPCVSRRWLRPGILAGVLISLPPVLVAQPADPAEAFLGTWSGVFTAQEHEFWTSADLACFVGCPLAFYSGFSALLADPANDSISVAQLSGQADAAWQEDFESTLTPHALRVREENLPEYDPKFVNCQPYGFVREVTNPLPMQIRRDDEHLLIRYEEWSLLRSVYMDGREQPQYRTPSLLGHSVGRIEDGVLIIETERLTPDWVSDSSRVGHSGELTAVERYKVMSNPRRLELTVTLTDPVMFTEPLVVTKTWLSTPDVELLQDSCFQQPGKPD